MLSHAQWASVLKSVVYSIGHSSLSGLEFLELLQAWSISAIADVRSVPWSRRNSQFNRDNLSIDLENSGILYRFMGKSLGGRPASPDLYSDGVADYEKMASVPAFQAALKRVKVAATKHRLALLCSEHDPIECHRCLLVGRSLDQSGIELAHIISHDCAQSQREIEARLLKATGGDQPDFLRPTADAIGHSYREWSQRVAYSKKTERRLEGSSEGDYHWG